jgi:hypothetical protein
MFECGDSITIRHGETGREVVGLVVQVNRGSVGVQVPASADFPFGGLLTVPMVCDPIGGAA